MLVEYGLIEENLLNILLEALSGEELEAAVIALLEAWNPAVRDLLSSYSIKSGKRELFLYGLLMGKMMNGETVKNIAKKSLI